MTREMPQVDGVEHRFVEANGIRIHLAEAGAADAPPLMLLHGWPQHWYVWRHVIGPLAEDRRVICPDLRGLGWTDAPSDGYEKERLTDDLFALLDELDVDRAGLVGHDWGGWISFLAGLRAPERFEGIVAAGIAVPFSDPSLRGAIDFWRFWYQAVLASPLGGRAAASVGLGVLGSAVNWLGPDAWNDEDREIFLGQFREPERARASVQYYRSFQLRELPAIAAGRYRDARLAIPSRLLVGEDDPVVKRGLVSGAEGRADDLRVEFLPDVGHYVPEARPELVIARARELFG
jgi:pimeloyl-ACP methyl ester carboxylesterase